MVVSHACTCTVLLLVSCVCHQFKVWLKPAAEQQFLYGHNVLKSGLGRITEGTAQYQGVVVYSMGDMPLVSGQHWPVALGDRSALTCCPVSLFSTDLFIALGECSALTYSLHWVSGQHWLVALGKCSALTCSLHWVNVQHWLVALGECSTLTYSYRQTLHWVNVQHRPIALGEFSTLTFIVLGEWSALTYSVTALCECSHWLALGEWSALTYPGWVISTDLPWVSEWSALTCPGRILACKVMVLVLRWHSPGKFPMI